MRTQLFCLMIALFIFESVYSQSILRKMERYNISRIEKQAIKRTKKRLGLSKKMPLGGF